jgi:hypothetical protein
LPSVDAEVLAQCLNVGNQMPRGIFLQTGMWRRTAAATLIEKDDAVGRRIKVSPKNGLAAAAWSAMKKHHRFAIGITALLEVEFMAARHFHAVGHEGFYNRVEAAPVRCFVVGHRKLILFRALSWFGVEVRT